MMQRFFGFLFDCINGTTRFGYFEDISPDIEAALKDPKFSQIETSSSQDFHLLPKLAVKLGVDLVNGKKPDKVLTLVPSSLVTRENVGSYVGWNAKQD